MNYEVRGSKTHMSAEEYDMGALGAFEHDLKCLVPYLSVDREAFMSSTTWFADEAGHMSALVQCSPIDEDDMMCLIKSVAARHFDVYSIVLTVTA